MKSQEHKVLTKRSKYIFASSLLEYLGHMIDSHRVSTDPRKIEAVVSWLFQQMLGD